MNQEDKKVKDLIHTIGLLNNLKDDEIRKIVNSQFDFTYKTMRELSFKDLSIEEIDKLKTNFYYKYIGKLYTSGEIVHRHIKSKEDLLERLNIKKNE